MGRYLTEFLSLRCAPDVLGAVGNLGNKPEKEITEAWGVIKKIKKIVLRQPYKYRLVDLCSGNALVPAIATHLLPITHGYAIDKKQRERNWHRIDQFAYLQLDINKIPDSIFSRPTILTAVHSCGTLAEKTIKIFNETPNIKHLILMPCCIGKLDSQILRFLRKEVNPNLAWVVKLAMQCDGNINIVKDTNVLSPRNYIISASK